MSYKLQLLTSLQSDTLLQVKTTLIENGFKNINDKFYQTIPMNPTQLCYAIGKNSQNKICVIYSLHKQYKLTRGLSTTYHLQKIYGAINKQNQEQLQQILIDQLQGYKITGINVTQNKIFKPHQKYMSCKINAHL